MPHAMQFCDLPKFAYRRFMLVFRVSERFFPTIFGKFAFCGQGQWQ
jgi:hypothetical protein